LPSSPDGSSIAPTVERSRWISSSVILHMQMFQDDPYLFLDLLVELAIVVRFQAVAVGLAILAPHDHGRCICGL
jgi:hypothetical protein